MLLGEYLNKPEADIFLINSRFWLSVISGIYETERLLLFRVSKNASPYPSGTAMTSWGKEVISVPKISFISVNCLRIVLLLRHNNQAVISWTVSLCSDAHKCSNSFFSIFISDTIISRYRKRISIGNSFWTNISMLIARWLLVWLSQVAVLSARVSGSLSINQQITAGCCAFSRSITPSFFKRATTFLVFSSGMENDLTTSVPDITALINVLSFSVSPPGIKIERNDM